MARLVCTLALAASASAFVAPSAPAAAVRSTALPAIMDAGIGPETGNKIFDPAGFTKFNGDKTLAWYRHAEIKHGRVAMLATTGWIIQENGGGVIGFPVGKGPWETQELVQLSKKPIEALQQLPNAGFFQIVFTIGCLELWSETVKPHYTAGGTPGGLIPGFYMPTKAASLEAQNKELKNGRLAMIGIMSFFAAEAIPGSVPGYPW